MIDIKGQKFGMLTVIEFDHLNKTRHAVWKCRCECGNETLAQTRYLKNGKKRSCGCQQHQIGENHFGWQGVGEISLSEFNKLKRGAERRNLAFNVTIDYIWDLFIKQNRRCAVSNEDICFKSMTKKFDGTASLDRIDSSKGYEEGNVWWVHKNVNTMKWDLTLYRFYELIKKIYEFKGMKEIGTSLTLSR